MTNTKKFINFLIAYTLMNILKETVIHICCMNCNYYYVNDYVNDNNYCIIDKQEIHPNISHIVKCKAFELWFGSM